VLPSRLWAVACPLTIPRKRFVPQDLHQEYQLHEARTRGPLLLRAHLSQIAQQTEDEGERMSGFLIDRAELFLAAVSFALGPSAEGNFVSKERLEGWHPLSAPRSIVMLRLALSRKSFLFEAFPTSRSRSP
jgi:hypothetical protein